MVDAEPVRQHLDWLAANGVGRRTVATGVGVAEPTLYRISHGETRKVMRYTARKLLAFNPNAAAEIANSRMVDATATRLRYQALIALGYTQAYIAGETGRAQGGLDLRERVYQRRALAILELCKRVGETPGPSKKAATQALNKGWRKPCDFDDDLFYDPTWDGSEPEAEAESRSQYYVEEYDFLKRCGVVDDTIAERLGISPGYLQALLSRRERRQGPFVDCQLGLAG